MTMGILTRIWEGNFVYQEPICFSEDAEGHPIGGQLLYLPEQILSVTSFDGSIFYEEGSDYIQKNSQLVLTSHSRIPFLSRDVYCKPFTGVPETAWVRLPNREQYMEVVSDVYRWQILVTYTHKAVWDGFSPVNSSSLLPKSMQKLQNMSMHKRQKRN